MFYVQDGCPMQVLTYVVFVLKILLNMTGVYLHYSSQVACRPVHSKRLFNSKILHRGKDMVFLKKLGHQVFLVLLALMLIFHADSSLVNANSNEQKVDFHEETITFESGTGEYRETLHGTVLIPNQVGRKAGIVLAHGSGVGDPGKGGNQKDIRKEAEVFARAGIVTLIYNKRSKGYSKTNRSYELLAQDLIAGVKFLQTRSDIDNKKVGVWGLSEGGWVAPLAASQTDDIAFVITSGAPGISPAQQQTWNVENRLRHQGVQSKSAIHSLVYNGAGVVFSLPGSGAVYNPVPPLQKIHQPFLAIWGSKDRQVPPAESAEIFKNALDKAGNRNYVLQYIEGADHSIYNNTDDGFVSLKTLYPGYAEAMTSWLFHVINGQPPVAQTVGQTPVQMSKSLTDLTTVHWYDYYWFQLGISVLFLLIFIGCYFVSIKDRLKKKTKAPSIQRLAGWTALTGMISILSFWMYLISLWTNGGRDIGWVIAGIPFLWIVIQLLATITAVLITLLIISCLKNQRKQQTSARVKWILYGGIPFIPWAIYWHLLFF